MNDLAVCMRLARCPSHLVVLHQRIVLFEGNEFNRLTRKRLIPRNKTK